MAITEYPAPGTRVHAEWKQGDEYGELYMNYDGTVVAWEDHFPDFHRHGLFASGVIVEIDVETYDSNVNDHPSSPFGINDFKEVTIIE
jgi:hypothetical protein